MPDQGSEGLLSPWLRRLRIEAARPYLRGRVLDVGCGSGALAQHCRPENYTGYDIDRDSLMIARRERARYRFVEEPPYGDRFDTVVALAVIEHLSEPAKALKAWRAFLAPGGQIVLTTPHPSADWIHHLGARVGLFSWHGYEEHEQLINLIGMRRLASEAGLSVELYRRFLFGANQLFVFV